MSKPTHKVDEFEHKGRKITIHTSFFADLTKGYWKFYHEGKEHGVELRVSGENHVQVAMILAQDVRFLLDDPEGYARKCEEAEQNARQERVDRQISRREGDGEYRDVVDRAVEECGAGVESYLQEIWDMWADS